MMRTILKHAALAVAGGCLYYGVELLWRGHSHWTMAVLGGVCFMLIGGLNNWLPWDMSLLVQGMAGAAIVTGAELAAGCVLNLWLGLAIWDYSDLPCNLWGQICLSFSLAWVALSVVAVVLDDWLRHWWFGEERPHYKLI